MIEETARDRKLIFGMFCLLAMPSLNSDLRGNVYSSYNHDVIVTFL